MARAPQTMSRIRTRDHSPVINQPTDLDRKLRRGLNGSFASSAKELKADGDINPILKSKSEGGNTQPRFSHGRARNCLSDHKFRQ